MSTALMIRPKENPPVRVLEVDGPKQKYVQRGEGSYYLATDNNPFVDYTHLYDSEPDPRLKDWDGPHWEIYLNNDGTVDVHACRPTEEEVISGDLHGRLGSVIRLRFVARHTVNNARWLARKLTKCDPEKGVVIPKFMMAGFESIETDIPVFTTREWPIQQPESAGEICICQKPKGKDMKVCWHCFKHRTDAAPYKDFQGTYEEWVQQLPSLEL